MRQPRFHAARSSADVAFPGLRLTATDGLERWRLDNFLGRLFRPLILALLALALAGCGSPTAEASKAPPAESVTANSVEEKPQSSVTKAGSQKTKTTETVDESASKCPVTVPTQPGLKVSAPDDAVYTEAFPAPEPYPRQYPHDGMVWYGTEDLWTVLPVDGEYEFRKSVWWSSNFPGGTVEQEPKVHVTWTRLDTDEPVVIDNEGRATNAHTADEGWFMIAGIDPDQPGCWKVEASYKDSTLSYVYQRQK